MGKMTWAAIAALLTAVVLIGDALTHTVGIVRMVLDAYDEATLTPTVRVSPRDQPWGGQCLEFAFRDLPADFSLGTIELEIVDASGPSAFAGSQAADLFETTVNHIVDESVLLTRQSIVFRAPFEATKTGDAAYVDFCPVMMSRGMRGSLTVRPRFREPGSSEAIAGLTLETAGAGDTAEIVLAHPKNLVYTLEDGRLSFDFERPGAE